LSDDEQRAAVLGALTQPQEAADVSRAIARQLGDRQAPVVMTAVDTDECFARQIENWACSLRRYDVKPYLIFALDNATHARLTAQGEPSVRVETVSSFGGAIGEYRSLSYRQVCFSRIYAVLILLALRRDVVMLDVDIVLAADPRPALIALAARDGRDGVFQVDYPNAIINSGAYLLRSTTGAVQLMLTLAHQAAPTLKKDGAPPSEQDLLNAYLKSRCGANPHFNRAGDRPSEPGPPVVVNACKRFPLSLATIDARLFRTGHPHSVLLSGQEDAVLWHANFMVGGQTKHRYLLGDFAGRRLWCSANVTLCRKGAAVVEVRDRRAPGLPKLPRVQRI
jgi:hypothetical protein